MTDTLDRKHSVTKADYVATPDTGGVFVWNVFDTNAIRGTTITLPPYTSPQRDQVLAASLDLEDMWAIAVGIACSKIAVRGYEVQDKEDSDQRVKRGQGWVKNFDGLADYRSGIVKVALDFFTTNNGWFVEIERVSSSPSSRIKALWHLDSHRCYRTGNLKYPVIYLDNEGAYHKLRADQVIFGSDMSSPRSRTYGRGRCAADRVFRTICTASGMETYFHEKITGSRALALYFISGLSHKQLTDAMTTSEEEKNRKGLVVYKGAVMVPVNQQEAINIASIDLAGVPDGFNVDSQRDDYYLRFTKALGLAAQGIKPLSGQGLGTGKQTEVLDDVTDEEGATAFFTKQFEDKLNQQVMPESTTFTVTVNDLRNRIRQAELDKMKTDTLVALMGSGQAPGVISQQMALNIAVDEGLVPREFLPKDATPGGRLTDSGEQSKPVGDVQPAVVPPTPAPQLPLTKAEKRREPDLDDATMARAKELYERVKRGRS